MRFRLRRRQIAVLSTAAVVAGALTAYDAGGRVSHEPMTVTAQFEDSTGLYVGNSVSVLGIPVGKVARIEPKTGYVDVTLTFDKKIDIPADVQAVTVSTSILTDRHVELTPPYHGGPILKNGDVVGRGRTRTPVEFDKTLAMVDKLAVALRGDGAGSGPVASLLNIGAKLTSGTGARDLKATLDQLSQALRLGSDSGVRSSEHIQTIVTSLDTLTRRAAENDSTIREFTSNLRQLSDILATENLGAGTAGAKLNDSLAQATSLLQNNRGSLKSTIANADTITKAVVDYRRELAEFFDVAPLMLDNAANFIDPNAGVARVHFLPDKVLLNNQLAKELCNLLGVKQLGCGTGTARDYGPDFGLQAMFELMAGGTQ